MKKIYLILMLLILTPFIFPKSTIAGGGSYYYKVYANKSSAPADGVSTITITVNTFYYDCDYEYPEGGHLTTDDPSDCSGFTPSTATKYNVSSSDYLFGKLYVSSTGNNNTISKDNFHTINGFATFTIKSTKAESKTIKITDSEGGFNPNWDYSETVIFTTPTTTTTENNNTTSTPTSTSTTQTQEKEEAKKPETPVLNKLRVGENELTGEKLREENQFRYEEGVKFSGTTVPNGIVHLYFNSDPYETTVTADKDGNWEYTLDKDLGEGSHTLEIAVEDPETNELSDKSEAYSFTLVAGETTSEPSTEVTQEETEDTSYSMYFWFLIGGIVVVLVGSGIGGWYYFKKKQTPKKLKSEPEPRLKNQ